MDSALEPLDIGRLDQEIPTVNTFGALKKRFARAQQVDFLSVLQWEQGFSHIQSAVFGLK